MSIIIKIYKKMKFLRNVALLGLLSAIGKAEVGSMYPDLDDFRYVNYAEQP